MVAARSEVLAVQGGGIPLELKACPQWINWRLEERDGEWTKVPYTPGTKRKASSTNPRTWGTFDEAQDALQPPRYEGIGFVFASDDPYCGIDLDDCRNSATGEIEKWAEEIVEALGSYSELSPSGKGVHVIVKGTLPPGGRRRGQVEMYDTGRFFTVTGERLDDKPYEIVKRDEALSLLHGRVFRESKKTANDHKLRGDGNGLSDQEVVARAMRASNGDKIARLWAGELNGHASHSEADLALCSCLAFWTGGDAEMIDRLFRQSGLYRPKWDERRGTHTYGEATIDKALEVAGQFYHPKSQSLYSDGIRDAREDQESMGKNERPRLQSLRFNELPEPGPRRYLLDGLVPEGYPTLLHGDGGSAKSMLALSFGLAVARQGEK